MEGNLVDCDVRHQPHLSCVPLQVPFLHFKDLASTDILESSKVMFSKMG